MRLVMDFFGKLEQRNGSASVIEVSQVWGCPLKARVSSQLSGIYEPCLPGTSHIIIVIKVQFVYSAPREEEL